MSWLLYNPVPGANKFVGGISNWDVSSVTEMNYMFAYASSFNGDINKWDVSRVTNIAGMFTHASSFSGDISKWDVSRVTKMADMFSSASSFNSDLWKWDVSSVTDMTGMFSRATAFDIDISKWDVLSVTNMDHMFLDATSFKQKLCGADWVNSKASKRNMFIGSSGSISRTVCTITAALSSKAELKDVVDECLELCPTKGDCSNGPHRSIAEWDVSSVTDMASMFMRAISFNGDLSNWDVSRVTGMAFMFMGATSFNGDLSKWDVSRVTSMNGMFTRAKSFNIDLSKWEVSRVSNMASMFREAKVFNRDLSQWDVSSVTNMNDMFLNAVLFNQRLRGMDWLRSKASKKDMFKGSSGSIPQAAYTSAPTPLTNQASEYVSPRPTPERELIVRTPTSTPSITSNFDRTITCPKCGTFRKSGRASCCAPGGAWYKNCGGRGSKSVDHRWSEGVKACKRKYNNVQLYDETVTAERFPICFPDQCSQINTNSHDKDNH